MAINKIIWSDQDHALGQLGGGAWLEDLALWPTDPKSGKPMLPLVMMTSRFLSVPFIPEGMAITVFISVERSQGHFKRSTLREFTVNQQSDLPKLNVGHSKVLLHTLADHEMEVSTVDMPITRQFIAQQPLNAEEMADELDDEMNGAEMSKVLGRPCWLQDPIDETPRYYFLAQLLDADISVVSPNHEGLFANGIGYIFADNRAKKLTSGADAGYFFIQFT